MRLTRRKFLVTGPLAAGAVLQLNGVALGQRKNIGLFQVPDLTGDALSRLTWDSFYPFIHTDFTFGQGANSVSLKLVSMHDSRLPGQKSGRSRGKECFVLKFQGPFDRPLKQGTYRVDHFNLGDFDLFITDGGLNKREQYYTAVVNRIVS